MRRLQYIRDTSDIKKKNRSFRIFFRTGLVFIFLFTNPNLSRAKSLMSVVSDQPFIIWSGNTRQKLVALTFDDGPEPQYTPKVLRILKSHRINATFFVVGSHARAYPDLINKEIEAGNELANHTYDHTPLEKENLQMVNKEIVSTDALFKDRRNYLCNYFRPPKGKLSSNIIYSCATRHKKIILWTLCVENHKAKTPAEMIDRAVKAASPGMIILAHDGQGDRSNTIAALPGIIKAYQRKGYRFLTLYELLSTSDEQVNAYDDKGRESKT